MLQNFSSKPACADWRESIKAKSNTFLCQHHREHPNVLEVIIQYDQFEPEVTVEVYRRWLVGKGGRGRPLKCDKSVSTRNTPDCSNLRDQRAYAHLGKEGSQSLACAYFETWNQRNSILLEGLVFRRKKAGMCSSPNIVMETLVLSKTVPR